MKFGQIARGVGVAIGAAVVLVSIAVLAREPLDAVEPAGNDEALSAKGPNTSRGNSAFVGLSRSVTPGHAGRRKPEPPLAFQSQDEDRYAGRRKPAPPLAFQSQDEDRDDIDADAQAWSILTGAERYEASKQRAEAALAELDRDPTSGELQLEAAQGISGMRANAIEDEERQRWREFERKLEAIEGDVRG